MSRRPAGVVGRFIRDVKFPVQHGSELRAKFDQLCLRQLLVFFLTSPHASRVSLDSPFVRLCSSEVHDPYRRVQERPARHAGRLSVIITAMPMQRDLVGLNCDVVADVKRDLSIG
jgi:hypothetical protein